MSAASGMCTLLLDEPLSDEEIWQRIEESRAQTR